MSLRLLVPLAAALLVALVAALTAWHASATSVDTTSGTGTAAAQPAVIRPSAPLPAPTGETLLTVTGVERGNVRPHVTRIDDATLDRLATEEVTVYEPFLKRDVTFTGVRMDELLRRAGVGQSTKRLHMHALDDYTIDLPIADIASTGLLATRMDGRPMPVADGGPVRVVFEGESPTAANSDNWIWSVDAMRAHG